MVVPVILVISVPVLLVMMVVGICVMLCCVGWVFVFICWMFQPLFCSVVMVGFIVVQAGQLLLV